VAIGISPRDSRTAGDEQGVAREIGPRCMAPGAGPSLVPRGQLVPGQGVGGTAQVLNGQCGQQPPRCRA